jgi:hypothetical protein
MRLNLLFGFDSRPSNSSRRLSVARNTSSGFSNRASRSSRKIPGMDCMKRSRRTACGSGRSACDNNPLRVRVATSSSNLSASMCCGPTKRSIGAETIGSVGCCPVGEGSLLSSSAGFWFPLFLAFFFFLDFLGFFEGTGGSGGRGGSGGAPSPAVDCPITMGGILSSLPRSLLPFVRRSPSQ